MDYSPKFTITPAMLSAVGRIDAAREVITHAPLVPAWERRFQSDARVRTIHHGTHLEGNNLNFDEVEKILELDTTQTTNPNNQVLARERDVQEVINYRRVMDYLDELSKEASSSPLPLTEAMLKEVHRLTVTRLLDESESGHYRTVKVVIRNTSTGEISFRPPSPLEVPLALSNLFSWVNTQGSGGHPLLRAGLFHYELVRIHPFTDGNGRTARAMVLLLLFLEGYELKKFFSLDEYYDSEPGEYYEALQSAGGGDLTQWLEYFTLGIAIEFDRVKQLVQKLSLDLHLKNTLGGRQIALSDRQIRLVEYMERHGGIAMSEARDLISQVSEDTILRDLRDLVDKKLILKKGSTKGTKYYLSK